MTQISRADKRASVGEIVYFLTDVQGIVNHRQATVSRELTNEACVTVNERGGVRPVAKFADKRIGR